MLDENHKLDIYVKIIFNSPITPRELEILKYRGFTTKAKIQTEYLGQQSAVFYGKYNKLGKITRLTGIQDILILEKYIAKGYYKLSLRTEKPVTDIQLAYALPHSKPGKKILSLKQTLISASGILDKSIQNSQLTIRVNSKGMPITLYCELFYLVDLYKILQHSIRVAGRILYADYSSAMKNPEHSPIYTKFTRESAKIKFSDYVLSVADKLRTDNNIRDK
jgi:hypothetical protein